MTQKYDLFAMKRGEQKISDLTHSLCEKYFKKAVNGDVMKLNLNDSDKTKFYNVFYDIRLSEYNNENIHNISNFIINNFTNTECELIIKNLINRYLQLEDVMGFKINNSNIITLYSDFGEIIELVDCVIIDRTNADDVIGIFSGYSDLINSGEYNPANNEVIDEVVSFCEYEKMEFHKFGEDTILVVFNTPEQKNVFTETYTLNKFFKIPTHIFN